MTRWSSCAGSLPELRDALVVVPPPTWLPASQRIFVPDGGGHSPDWDLIAYRLSDGPRQTLTLTRAPRAPLRVAPGDGALCCAD